ncbi:hypothetical protein [Humibacillus xanthopallidus]|uniref:hypothetical protein n=1 Tax=Humibacillus xanthopallidus TaxID=412689 RepID=UPI00384D241B
MTKQPTTQPHGSGSVAPPIGDQPIPATAQDTRFFLIERSGRSFVPIAKVFVQNPNRRLKRRHGPLAEFVNNGDKRGLLAFLFVNTIISSGAREDGWTTSLDIKLWARALGTVETAGEASASNAATKILSRLVKRDLIERTRRGRERLVAVTLLRPDGSGAPYTRPTGRDDSERFLRLSHRFWLDEWDKKLSLPAIAMLLVALCEPPHFKLATEHVPDWYGWSADTAERGLKELADKKVLQVDPETYTNPLAPTGLSTRNRYTLLEPFDPDSIEASRPAPRRPRRRVTARRKKRPR